MNALQKENDKEEIKPENMEDIFCFNCLRIPKYDIIVNVNKSLKLAHYCTHNEYKKIDFPISSNKNNLISKCDYCDKNCFNICIECKKYICDKCKFEHIPEENEEEIIPVIIDKENN